MPPRWFKDFEQIFTRPTFRGVLLESSVTLTKTDPIPLTEVIVTALSVDAYRVACSQGSPLETWLSEKYLILRQGSLHTFSSESLPLNGHNIAEGRRLYQYRLNMTEPVLQGFAQKGFTRFYVTSGDRVKENISTDSGNESVSPEWEEGSESDTDGIEIDESFLANSVLQSRQNFPQSSNYEGSLTPSKGTKHNKDNPVDSTAQTGSSLRAESLSGSTGNPEDDCTVYLRTADIGRAGILNGDWVRRFLCMEISRSTPTRLSLMPMKPPTTDLFVYLPVMT